MFHSRQNAREKLASPNFKTGDRIIIKQFLPEEFKKRHFDPEMPTMKTAAIKNIPFLNAFSPFQPCHVLEVMEISKEYTYEDFDEDYIDGVISTIEARTQLLRLAEFPDQWMLADYFYDYDRFETEWRGGH